jgi:hypothetical protein
VTIASLSLMDITVTMVLPSIRGKMANGVPENAGMNLCICRNGNIILALSSLEKFVFIKMKMAIGTIITIMLEFVLTVKMENLNQKNLWRFTTNE